MHSKGWYYRVLAILLVLAMTLGHAGLLMSSGRQEPEDPIVAEADTLLTEQYTDHVSEGYLQMAAGVGNDRSESEDESEEESEEETETEEPEETETEEPEEQKPEEGTPSEGDGEKVDSDSGDAEKGDSGSGKDEGDGSGDELDPDAPLLPPEDELEEGLVTDLSTRSIFFSELEDDLFSFYAYYTPETVEANIRVNYRHEDNAGNGTWLRAKGHDYETKLKLGKNYITVYFNDSEGVSHHIRYILTYEADKADPENPVLGENPPTIITNLDDWEGYITQQNFTFIVTARTWKNEVIYSNHIRVTMDGKTITNPTGSSSFEYVLWFERPNIGDIGDHVITVLAWDEEGNSKYVEFHVQYYAEDDGAVIGSVTVVLDATTVGLGVLEDEMTLDLIQGESSADALLRVLEEYGYEADYAGSTSLGFYLRSLERADAFEGAEIPEHLMELLERDGAEFTEPCSRDRLGEFDFTRWSGWMCAVNNHYIGKGLSEYRLNGGDTLYLRFTVAMGKDISGSNGSGEQYGNLSGYCGKWIGGEFIEGSHKYEETDRVEPKPGKDGSVTYTCKICKDEYEEKLDKLPTDPETPDPDNPENPDTPDPDNPENPDTPDPDNPENPGTPDPDNPENPGTPDPDNPENPDTPDPDNPENPDTPDPENPDTPEPEPEPEPEEPDPEPEEDEEDA